MGSLHDDRSDGSGRARRPARGVLSPDDTPTTPGQGDDAPFPPSPKVSGGWITTSHLAGRRVGAYVVRRKIAQGGMGVVYEAYDESLDRPTAIKVISEEYFTNPDFVARFLREARTAARVHHPHVVNVYAAGCDSGLHYIAMEYVEGQSLAEVIAQRSPMALDEAVRYARQAAEGLDAIHAEGIVHRDIKPQNLLLDKRGHVRLTDYGLAKPLWGSGDQVTRTPVVMGTIPYVSPEQCEGDEATFASDIYALGVTLYQMIAGERPFKARTARELYREIKQGPAPLSRLRPETPRLLALVVSRMMAPQPEDRYATAREAADALGECLRQMAGNSGLVKGPSSSTLRLASLGSSKRAWWINVFVVLAFAAGLYAMGRPSEQGGAAAFWHTVNDAKYCALGKRSSDPNIVLVGVKQWPLPPELLKLLIAKLREVNRGASVVGIDLPVAPAAGFTEISSLGMAIDMAQNVVLGVREEGGAIVEPSPSLLLKAKGSGAVAYPRSALDTRVREMPLVLMEGGVPRTSFAMAVAKLFGRDVPRETATRGIDFSCLESLPVLEVEATRDSIAALGQREPVWMGKVAVVGALMDGQGMWTPRWDVYSRVSRLLLHGVCVENLLSGHSLRSLSWFAESIFAGILGLLAAAFAWRLSPNWVGVLWVGWFFVYVIISMGALRFAGVSLPMLFPLLALFAGSTISLWRSVFSRPRGSGIE